MGQRDDAGSFGAALRVAKERSGLSYGRLERQVVEVLGQAAPVGETLRQYHLGSVPPERADVVLVCALASIYGESVDSLSPTVADRARRASDLITAVGARTAPSRCIEPTPVAA